MKPTAEAQWRGGFAEEKQKRNIHREGAKDAKVREEKSKKLIQQLEEFRAADEREEGDRRVILKFVRERERPFDRGHLDGHLTGSALVVDSAGERVLLGFHRKLGRWLQPGGHGEAGETEGEAVALREALEETGIEGLRLHEGASRPFDLDVHLIPARGEVAAHRHLDLRYLVVAPEGTVAAVRDEEHREMRWFGWEEAERMVQSADGGDEGLLRMFRKARDFFSG